MDKNEVITPGLRLTQTVNMAEEGDSLPSAIPVFLGWGIETRSPAKQDASVHLQYLPVWEQWSVNLSSGQENCLPHTVRHYFDNGGGPCFVLLHMAPSVLFTDAQGLLSWWETFVLDASEMLAKEPAITLVAVPQLVGLAKAVTYDSGEDTLIVLWKRLLEACHNRPDLFFVLDAPQSPDDATACITQLRHDKALGKIFSRAAFYGPHLETDYGNRDDNVVPPSGAVLGVYARTDREEGVWKAPANEPVLHVVKPQYPPTLVGQWFKVDSATINLIRSFPGRGTRVWGCRTLAPDPTFRYVQVRRSVSWIEANLRQICRFAVFEPNNEITWFQVQGLCRAWLRRLWLQGGLAGEDEASAFTIRVGLNDSMTEADIEAGRLRVLVKVSVLHAAEFIDVSLVLALGAASDRREGHS